MFTGIVEEVQIVISQRPGELVIAGGKGLEGMRPGDSMAVNGVCLTIIRLNRDSFSVEVMPETLRRTNLGKLRPGAQVNLERPVSPGGRLGGHLVQGHVDATGRILSIVPEGKALLMRFAAPSEIMRYVVEKGFIAVDGVSLTVVDCDSDSFTVSLVGYTQQHSTLGKKESGDMVNLEVDIIAKYVERLMSKRDSGGGVTENFLAQRGFLRI